MKLAQINLDQISEYIDPFAIKNFIVSDNTTGVPSISTDFPFTLDGIAFIMCIKGEGRIKINFKEYDLEENTIITILPHFITELLSKSDDLLLEFLIFSVDFISEMPSSSSVDITRSIVQTSCLTTTKEEADKLLEFHSFIVKQYKRTDHPFREEMAKALLYALLSEIGGIYYRRLETLPKEDVGSASRQEEVSYSFFALLLEHHKNEKSLQYYADKMCLTPKYLSTVLKERTGRTAFYWINEALVSSTKYMLKTTNLTILQISEELNFPNPSFFGRFFKKHTGMTPMQYRER